MISQIPPQERGRFEQFIRRFRDCWNAEFSGPLVANHFESCLPSEADPLRRAVLIEVVAIDLVTRIDRGEAVSLLTYLKLDDELGAADQLPVALLQVEYFHRRKSPNPISAQAFASLFPAQAAEFLKLTQEADPQAQKSNSGTLICDPIVDAPDVRAISAGPKKRSRVDSQRTDRAVNAEGQTSQRDPWGTVSRPTDRIVSLEGGYKLIRKIGQGNFGEVWLSEAPGGVEVALKIVRIPAGQKTKHLEMRSLDLMKRMRHPFLMQVQAFWVSEEEILIAMELADQSLRDRSRESSSEEGMPLAELLRYMTEAAEGIDFLHREHVVHRDIKPENLLLLKGHIKVADFGLARFMDESGLTVVATQVAGSPLYMAPEVWQGKPVPYSDQYSLAVTYAELRMCRAPFSTSSMVAVMQEHLYGQPQLDGLDEPEQAVLRVALSKHPNDRYSTCTEMVQALADATASLSAAQLPSTAKPRMSIAWTLVPILALLGVLAFGVYKYEPWNVPSPVIELAITLREDVVVAYGEQLPMEISTLDPSDSIQSVQSTNVPAGVSLKFDEVDNRLIVSADLNAPVVRQSVGLTIKTSRGLVEKDLRVSVVDSKRLKLPIRTKPARHNSRRVEKEERILYESIEYALPGGDFIEFVLIPREQTADPSTFYIMKQEVINRWFAEFATANPEKIRPDSPWRQGALAGANHLGVDGDYMSYPVVYVSVDEAHAFAQWVVGLLPSGEQWDKAAGANQKDRGEGPFLSGGTKICVDRFNEGPLPSANSPDDVSLFGVYDLAGNVTELTRNLLNSPLGVPVKELLGTERVILRGSSYHDPVPWKFDATSDGIQLSMPYEESKPEVGFRVVIELL